MDEHAYKRRTRNILSSYGQKSRAMANRDRARAELGTPMPRTPHWTLRAACSSEDPEVFFSDPPKQAKEICATCPVILECLNAHLFEPFGVFGGKTPQERDNHRRNIRRRLK